MTIIKKSRKPSTSKAKSPKRRFDAGGDILADALSGRYRELTGPSGPRNPIATSAGADMGGPGKDLVRSGTSLARSGPSIDVDMPKRLRGIKDIGSGTGERVSRPALEGPSKAVDTATKSASKLGGLGRLAGRLSGPVGMALTPSDLGDDDTKTGYNAMTPTSKEDYLKNTSSKNSLTNKPGFKAKSDSGPALKNEANVGPPRPLGPTGSASASKPVAKAATKAATANRKAAADDDAFMKDLRASAARMKSATADAAQKTGTMKEKMSDFAGSFKKGGKTKAKPAAKAYAKGGLVKSSKSINGCAKKGLTRGVSR